MIERKNYGITHLSASGKEKYFSGAADFGTAAGRGFHTRPIICLPLHQFIDEKPKLTIFDQDVTSQELDWEWESQELHFKHNRVRL